jgi:5-methylcytosine-specific restriction endonuclease McrA
MKDGSADARPLQEFVCRGCQVVFVSHIKSIAYCSERCRFYTKYLLFGGCPVCGAMGEPRPWLLLTLEIRELSDQLSRTFALEHAKCLRDFLDSEGRLTECRCRRCRSQASRGDDRVVENAPAYRRPRPRSSGYRRHRAFVLARDKWTCTICGLKLDLEARWIEDQSATLDHIIPVVEGGDDEPDNLRAAHRWCNQARERGFATDSEIREVAWAKFAAKA